MKSFTKKEIEGAKRARELYRQLLFPSLDAFKWIIRSGKIKDCKVTVHNIVVAQDIWGKDVSALKGKCKTVRK